ncbi:hypothetical protein JCM11491_001999 [Sporobolomyces phaffii]
MVAARTLLSAFTFLAAAVTSSSAQILGLDLDLGLLKNGALVTADVFADVLTQESCPNGNVGIVANVLNLVKVCGCVSLLNLGTGQSVCPEGPANSTPVCGRGVCAFECNSGFLADSTTGTCVDDTNCTDTGGSLVSNNDGSFFCQCPTGFVQNNSGGCSLAPSAAARRRRSFAFKGPTDQW